MKLAKYSFFIFLFTLPLFFFASLLFLKDPLPWPDEAIYLDTAKTLNRTGVLATNIFGGAIPGLEKHSLWYPPFYFYLLSFWIKIFGETLESIRALSLIFAFFTLIIFFYTLKIIFKNDLLALLGGFILAFDFSFSRASRVARMDMFNFFLLTTIFLFFFLALKKEKDYKTSLIFYLFSGIFCGLAVITHPLGFIGPGTIILFIFFRLIKKALINKNKKIIKDYLLKIAMILIPTIIFFGLWLFSIRHHFNLFINQYYLQFLRKSPQVPFVITMWHTNHWWKLIFSFYGLITLLLFFNVITWENKNSITLFVFSLVGIITSTIAIFWGKEMWYPLYFQPIIALSLISLLGNAHQWLKKIITGIIFLIIFANINIFLIVLNQLGSDRYDYHSFTQKIAKKLPPHAEVFLATIPDPYFDLAKSEKKLKLYQFPTVPIDDRAYKRLLDQCDFLILNMIPDQRVEKYLNKYTKEKYIIGEPGEFSTTIFKLISKKERKEL